MEYIWCFDTTTALTTGLSAASGRLNRKYGTQEDKDHYDNMIIKPRGTWYLVQPGTIQELERNILNFKYNGKTNSEHQDVQSEESTGENAVR